MSRSSTARFKAPAKFQAAKRIAVRPSKPKRGVRHDHVQGQGSVFDGHSFAI